jgi:hypothetical protein
MEYSIHCVHLVQGITSEVEISHFMISHYTDISSETINIIMEISCEKKMEISQKT